MTDLGRTLRRLSGRSPRELLGRLTQLGWAELERLGWRRIDPSIAPARLMTELEHASGIEDAGDLLARFRERAETGPFSVFHDPARSVDVLRGRWPEAADRVLRRAERIEAGRFDLLGYEDLDFGDPVDWHLDPVHGIRAPLVHWSRVPYLDVEAVGDHKIIWELNRHQYLVDLGRAYWHSGDERWARLFAAHIGSWMEANAPKRGINWASSLELGFRSIAWLWALHFFLGSPSLTPALFGRMVTWLRLQGTHVERFVSTWFSPNTHLTGEALALVYLGELLPELPEASRWRAKGRAWMGEALRRQIRADGGYFEQSTHYGRYTADFYLHLLLLDGGKTARDRDGEAPDRGRVADLVDHLVALTRPDGRTPCIGDEDGGKLLFLDDRPLDDFRSTFLTAAVLCGRGDWAFVGGEPSEELVWLLGPEAPDRLGELDARPPTYASRALPDTGLFVTRSSWEASADHAVIRCGPHGALGAGHAHADALSIELTSSGTPLLVEMGTGSFMVTEVRERLRATTAHNTVTLGARSSSEPSAPFGWATRASSHPETWIARPGVTYFRGQHTGYERLAAGARHIRTVLWREGGGWLMHDRVGRADPGLEARGHFWLDPALEAVSPARGMLLVADPEGHPVATLLALEGSEWESVEGLVSSRYGCLDRARGWRRRAAGAAGGVELITLVLPGDQRDLASVEGRGGMAWRFGCQRDLLMAARPEATSHRNGAEAFASDFDWLWARPGPDGAWNEVLGVGGRRARLGGLTIEFPEPVRLFRLDREKGLRAEREDGSAVAAVRVERAGDGP